MSWLSTWDDACSVGNAPGLFRRRCRIQPGLSSGGEVRADLILRQPPRLSTRVETAGGPEMKLAEALNERRGAFWDGL